MKISLYLYTCCDCTLIILNIVCTLNRKIKIFISVSKRFTITFISRLEGIYKKSFMNQRITNPSDYFKNAKYFNINLLYSSFMFQWAIYSIYCNANPYWKTNSPPSEELKTTTAVTVQPNWCVLIKFVTHSRSIKRTAGISVRWNCLRWTPLCRLSFMVNSLWKP